MKNIIANLLGGINYFGSSSANSPEFNKFFNAFKKVMKKELATIGATDIEFSKGHFYLSGFFKAGEQFVYFSISDVRHGFGFNRNNEPEMLVRTAQSNKDYTGGANNSVVMAESIKRKLRL
jgi:hypothetical protein